MPPKTQISREGRDVFPTIKIAPHVKRDFLSTFCWQVYHFNELDLRGTRNHQCVGPSAIGQGESCSLPEGEGQGRGS